MLALVVLNHPDRALADLRRKRGCALRHGSSLARSGASGKPGAVQCPFTMVHAATAIVTVPLEDKDADLVTWILYREDEPSPSVSLVLEFAADVANEPFMPPLAEPRA